MKFSVSTTCADNKNICLFLTELSFTNDNPIKMVVNGESCTTATTCKSVKKMDGGFYLKLEDNNDCGNQIIGTNSFNGLSAACK